ANRGRPRRDHGGPRGMPVDSFGRAFGVRVPEVNPARLRQAERVPPRARVARLARERRAADASAVVARSCLAAAAAPAGLREVPGNRRTRCIDDKRRYTYSGVVTCFRPAARSTS